MSHAMVEHPGRQAIEFGPMVRIVGEIGVLRRIVHQVKRERRQSGVEVDELEPLFTQDREVGFGWMRSKVILKPSRLDRVAVVELGENVIASLVR